MSKPIRTTIDAANDRAISEQRAASSDPDFSLLAHHDELVDVIHGLLGKHGGKGRRRPHPPILRVSTMAPVAHAVRSALQQLVEGSEFTAAVESATQQCLDNVDPGLRPRWRAGARDAAMFAARDAIIAGVDRFLVELASQRPIKANVIAKPFNRSAKLDHSYRKDYWSAPLRRPIRKPKAHFGGAASKIECPDPSGFSVAEEAYWLLVLVQQMAWPLPDAFSNLYPNTVLGWRFSIDQVRYLIRRDWTWTTLHCARAGVRIGQLDAREASLVIARCEAQGEAPQNHPVFGRWPEPEPEAQEAWEDQKRAYFEALQSTSVLSPADTAFTMALVFAQCGWPMPALVTRLFPAGWVTRQLPAHLVQAALSRSSGFNLLDATMAGAALRELTPASIKEFSNRQADRDRRELYGYFDPHRQQEWLTHFFGEQGQGPVSLRDRLEKQMRQAINGNDQNFADRIALQDYYQAREIHAPRPPTTTPALVESQHLASEPEVEDAEEDDDAIAAAAASLVEQTPQLAAPVQKRPQSPPDADETRGFIVPLGDLRSAMTFVSKLSASEFEQASIELNSRYPNVDLIDIVRSLGEDRPMPLEKALGIFGLQLKLPTDDSINPIHSSEWQIIIENAQKRALESANVHSDHIKLLKEIHSISDSWLLIISTINNLSNFSGYKLIGDIIIFGDNLTDFHFPNNFVNISEKTADMLCKIFYFINILHINRTHDLRSSDYIDKLKTYVGPGEINKESINDSISRKIRGILARLPIEFTN